MIETYQNLEQFFNSLGDERGAKTQFVKNIARKTGCVYGSVHNWCLGTSRTNNPKYLQVLSEETGIEPEKLFGYVEE